MEEALFVVRENGTGFDIHLSISDNPDQTVVIWSPERVRSLLLVCPDEMLSWSIG
jgi:hypothetical protein